MTTTTPNVSPADDGITIRHVRGPRVPIDFTNARPLYEELIRLATLNRRSFTAECLRRLELSVHADLTPPPE